MKALKVIGTVLILALIVFIFAAPIGPVPGFFIGGNPTENPESWMDTSGIHEIKLRVEGALPRVVIIWVIEHADELHVLGAKDSKWISIIGDSAPVEARIMDNTYALRATLLTTGWEPIFKDYLDKYRP